MTQTDLDRYLREISGEDFTAKDFRTWAGTVLAAMALKEFEKFDSKAQPKKNVVSAIESVAERLGNKVAVCRQCYIHPDVIGAYMDGTLVETLKARAEKQLKEDLRTLPPEEAAVLAFLKHQLEAGNGDETTLAALASSLKTTTRQRRQATRNS